MQTQETTATTRLYQGILAARKGRELLLDYLGKLKNIETKFQAGLVSEADKESEKLIISELKKLDPDADYLAEESANPADWMNGPSSNPKGRWILDPLDGTTNYIHQFPVFCISMGFEIDKQIQVGIIDVPMMGEVYTAVRGQGAFVNGRRLSVSETSIIENSFLATGFYGDDLPKLQEQMKIFSGLTQRSRGIRRAGAAAYDLCLVAKGVFDAYWERGLKPWDSAAGKLIVEEAGGVLTNYEGNPYTPYDKTLVAGNPRMVAEILSAITPAKR